MIAMVPPAWLEALGGLGLVIVLVVVAVVVDRFVRGLE